MNRTTIVGVLVGVVTAAVLAGCSSTSNTATPAVPGSTTAAAPSSAAVSAAHNAADTAFVQGMIPHHAQAVQMSEMAAQHAANTQVKDLATRIQKAQGPEIEQMRGFLTSWGEPETGAAGPGGSMGGMDHSTMGSGSTSAVPMQGMGGMMSDQQMQQLGQAGGATFDRMFLQMMIEHHNGAIQMAQTELANGQNPDAQALAQKIINAQQAEIVEMQNMLSTL